MVLDDSDEEPVLQLVLTTDAIGGELDALKLSTDVVPPAGIDMQLAIYVDDPDAKQLVEIVRDEHGNAVGGLRLPHLFAPVGTYVGLGEGGKSLGDSSAFFLKSAGTFYPFDDDQLRELYPTHGAYVSRVAHGADYAFDSGWILSADQDAYIQSAAQSDYGK